MSLLTLPVPKDIRGLLTAMETLHTPKGPYVTPTAPTLEPFRIFCPGPLAEGASLDCKFYSPEAAVRAFWFEFLKYSEDHKNEKLYWRMKPVMSHDLEGKLDVYQIRARYLLSNKPVVSRDTEAECLGLKRAS